MKFTTSIINDKMRMFFGTSIYERVKMKLTSMFNCFNFEDVPCQSGVNYIYEG